MSLDQTIEQLRGGTVNDADVISLQRRINNEPSLVGQDDRFVSQLVPLIISALNSSSYYDLDPNFALIDLLESVLRPLPLDYILQQFPISYITDALDAQLPQIALLVLKVINSHADDMELVDSGLLYKITQKYLQVEDLPVSVVSQIELLFSTLSKVKFKSVLEAPDFHEIYSTAANGTSTLVARLLDLIVILSPQIDLKRYMVFSFGDLDDDPLHIILLITFYEKIINIRDLALLDTVHPAVDEIAEIFKLRNSNDTVASFFVSEIVLLFAAYSYAFPDQFIQFGKSVGLLKSFNLYLELDSDILLLSKLNAAVLLTIEEDLLAYLSEYPLFNQKYFSILLNLLKDENCLNYLISHENLTSARLNSLSSDNVYQILFNLTLTDLGVKFLLNDLPNIVSDYLTDTKPVLNTEVYGLKVGVLENLLFNEYDLLIWGTDLANSYNLMKNGHNIKHEARVEVMDQAA